MRNPKIAVLIPCHRRHEYTAKCLISIQIAQQYPNTKFFLYNDGSNDGITTNILTQFKCEKEVIDNKEPVGLRNVMVDFFNKTEGYDIISKIDNDCVVPENWLNNILEIMEESNLDMVSPNVLPSNAAMKYGVEGDNPKVRMTDQIGGVWTMKRHLVDDIWFEPLDLVGIQGATLILNRIRVQKEPKMAWLPTIKFQDMGHWSGVHPHHIKSKDHEEYSNYVRRPISWHAQEK